MQSASPLSLYQQKLAQEEYQPDEIQRATILQLNKIYQQLSTRQLVDSISSGLFNWLSKKWSNKSKRANNKIIQGLYIWGGVGRGKTWMMSLFYHSLPSKRKLRLHFHRFMLRVYQEMARLQGYQDPLEIIADNFKAETDILCFDEFFVNDITDAMLLSTLIKAFFARGITLVVTSNISPDDLYLNGIQRIRFLPTIELIKRYCVVMNVGSSIDYRLRALTQTNLWFTPLNGSEINDSETSLAVTRVFHTLVGKDFMLDNDASSLEINHRMMKTLGFTNGVIALDFTELCGGSYSQNDYVVLSECFHIVLLQNVQPMNSNQEDIARRFLLLVDEFYERRVKLVVIASVPMSALYHGQLLRFEYQRCLSRLQEMQSQEYLKLEHQPH